MDNVQFANSKAAHNAKLYPNAQHVTTQSNTTKILITQTSANYVLL